jgi:hypothetical protein
VVGAGAKAEVEEVDAEVITVGIVDLWRQCVGAGASAVIAVAEDAVTAEVEVAEEVEVVLPPAVRVAEAVLLQPVLLRVVLRVVPREMSSRTSPLPIPPAVAAEAWAPERVLQSRHSLRIAATFTR